MLQDSRKAGRIATRPTSRSLNATLRKVTTLNSSDETPFNANARKYFDNGWHPMPVWNVEAPVSERAKGKNSPPKGFTGRTGKNADRTQINDWISSGKYYNIATRIPNGVMGLDVDVYHGGDETLDKLIEECGDLPETVMSTARVDGSGIRLFRVPEGVQLIEGLPGIEIIQPHHRYAMVWPSVHPELKKPYRWVYSNDMAEYEEDGDKIPTRDELPYLPKSWLARLQEKKDTGHLAKKDLTSRERRQLQSTWTTSGKMCSHLKNALTEASASSGSRHDACRNSQLTIVRLGEAGHAGSEEAMDDLKSWFYMAMGGDRDVDSEWDRGLDGAYAMIAASPTPEGQKLCSDAFQERMEDKVLQFHRDREDRKTTMRRIKRKKVDEDDEPEEEDDEQGDDGQDAGDSDGVERDGRLRINVVNKNRTSTWLRHEVGRNQLAGMFHRDGELVYTPRVGEQGYVKPKTGHDGPAQVRIVEPIRLKTAVEVRYSVGVGRQKQEEYTADDGTKQTRTVMEWDPKMFPTEAAMHAHDASRNQDDVPNLRVLKGVTHTPLVRKDGSILDKPGYDEASRLLYLPDGDLTVPAINEDPSEIEIRKAVRYIEQIVEQFPFVEDYHRANWYGALFTPIMRDMLPPPYPAFIIDAPAPGSGKSYLAMAVRTVHGGVLRAGFPNEDAEFEKQVVGILADTTAPVVQFDNVRGKVRSAKFEALLTSSSYSARMLGTTNSKTVANDRLWIITANNAEIGGDLARRSYWITIDPRRPRPFERSGFKLDLTTWLPAHRGEIIHALMTVVRAWVVAGMPKAAKKRSDDYANWDAAMEGMLAFAGFQGQFGLTEEKHRESDDDTEWGDFLEGVYEAMGSKLFTIAELIEKMETGESWNSHPVIDPSKLPGDLADKWSRISMGSKAGFTKSLGRWFGYRAGRYVGDLVVYAQANGKKGNQYRIASFAEEQKESHETA